MMKTLKSFVLFILALYVVGMISKYQSEVFFDADYVRITSDLIPALYLDEIMRGALTTAIVLTIGAVLSMSLWVTSALALLAGLTFSAAATVADAGTLNEVLWNATSALQTFGAGWLIVVLISVAISKTLKKGKQRTEFGD